MDICIQLCLCTYEIPRLLSLLVLVCIAPKDERDISSKFGVSTPALLYCIKCSPTLTGILVLALCLLYDSLLGVLVFGCVARCRGCSWQAWGFHSSVAV